MQIEDIEGKPIEITDLGAALEIAELYLNYHSQQEQLKENPFRVQAAQWYAYWQDIYSKLMQLQAEQKQQCSTDKSESYD